MKSEDLYRAVGSVDDALLDKFENAKPQKRMWPAYGAIAACLCLLLGGALYLTKREAPHAPTRPVALQAQTTAPTQQSAPTASIPMPLLSELPQLQFAQGGGELAADIGLPRGYFFRDLTDEQAASIWGQEKLNWEGYDPKAIFVGEQQLIYDGSGSVWAARLFGSVGDGSFALTLAPEQLPPTCIAYGGGETCIVYDTPVTAVSYGTDGNRGCEISFLCGEGKAAVGVRIEANWTGNGEAMLEVLTRIVSQSLRPEGILQLTQLRVSEVPEWRSERLTEEAAYAEVGFGEYLPDTLPDGYGFESAHRELGEERNYLSICWTSNYDNFSLTVDKCTDLYGLVHADEVEKYDRYFYGDNKPDVPDEYWDSWSDPLFYADELTMEVIERRLAEVDMGNVHGNFRVLYPDGTVLRVSFSADRTDLDTLLRFLLP